MLKQVSIAGALVVLWAAIATASPAPPPKNLDILNAVSRTVNTYSFFTIFDDVNASAHNGVVTLTGKVTMPYKRTDIGARVKALNGVRSVENKIEVLPVSFFDDALRYRIARAIYSDPNFWYAANMSNPPIHVIVDRGHVTITGVVMNDMDKVIVRSLAGQSGAFSITMDLKTPTEVQDALEHA